MEFTINQKTLVNALKVVAPAVGKGRVEFLKLVHIEASGQTVQFKATNLDLTLTVTEKVADLFEWGMVCVNHKALSDLVSKLPKGADIRFKDGGNSAEVVLTTGSIRRPLSSLPSEEFPHSPFTGNPFQSFDQGNQGTLHRALERVLPCVARSDESRAIMQGVLFQSGPSGAKISATDGRRAMRLAFASGSRENWQAVIPGKALQVLAKLLKDPKQCDQACSIRYNEGQAWCRVVTGPGRSVKWQVRCLEGVFPDLDRVYPKSFSRSWAFDSRDLVGPLERAMAGNKANPYKSKADNEDIVVFSLLGGSGFETMQVSGQQEDVTEKVPAPGWDGDPLRFSLNGEYLLELFRSPVGQMIVLNIQDETRAMTLHGSSGLDWEMVIMPIKLRQPVAAE